MLHILLMTVTLLTHVTAYTLETDGRTACQLVQAYIPTNPIILEAGAHHGEDTAAMKRLWPHSTIHAFEPHPENYKRLVQNTKYISNVHHYALALNDITGTAQFYCCGINDGASSLLESSPERKSFYKDHPPIMVTCMTLDDWAQRHGIERIDFCWLDMEGAELKMLQHATRLLPTIKAIYIEVNFQEFRTGMAQYAEIKKFLTEQGFQQVFITPGTAYDVQANVLFVRTDILQPIRSEQ